MSLNDTLDPESIMREGRKTQRQQGTQSSSAARLSAKLAAEQKQERIDIFRSDPDLYQ